MSEKLLIDKYLPEFTFNEFHEIVVNCPIEDVYAVAKDLDLSKSGLIKILFKIRGIPTKRMNLPDLVSDLGHTSIDQDFPSERLFGLWARTKVEPITSHEEFIDNAISARVKIVYNFHFVPLSSTQTRVSTETRILCIHPLTKILFSLYWLFVRPFSGIIRMRMLRIIKQDSETMHASK